MFFINHSRLNIHKALSKQTSFFCRDASFGNCTYNLTILDCLQGIRKVNGKVPDYSSILDTDYVPLLFITAMLRDCGACLMGRHQPPKPSASSGVAFLCFSPDLAAYHLL